MEDIVSVLKAQIRNLKSKAELYHEEMAVRGKEIEKLNRVRKLPREGENAQVVFKKIDKIMDEYELRCTKHGPSYIKQLKNRKCNKREE